MRARRVHSGGYALFLVMFAVTLLALVLLGVAQVQGDLTQNLRLLRTEAAHEIEAENLTVRATYLLLTQPIGPRSIMLGGSREPDAASGVGAREVRLDGRYYRAGRDALVAVQDEAGLLNLNGAGEAALSALLAQAGAANASRLAASLADYIDPDSLTRPGGGESQDYRRAGEPAPPNRALSSRWAAMNALGWRAAFAQNVNTRFWEQVSARGGEGGVNLNTTPGDVLTALLADERRAGAILFAREQRELRAAEDIEALVGAATDADGAGFATRPGMAFRVRIAFGESTARAYETEVVLADPDADRPFYWRDRGRVRTGEAGKRDNNAIEPFPGVAALDSP